MRYFRPHFQLATLAPPEPPRLRNKLGGIPFGLPAELWPTCCGHPQKLFAQLLHNPPILDLGTDGDVLFVFQCLECLGINKKNTGLESFIVNRSHLSNAPATVPGYDDKPEYGDPLIGEIYIEGFEEFDDGIPPERLSDFFTWDALQSVEKDFPNIEWFEPEDQTKFGGSPRWTGNGPMSFPPPPFEFLLQFCEGPRITGPVPTPDQVGCGICQQTFVNGSLIDQQISAPTRDGPLNAPWGLLHVNDDPYYYFGYTNLATDGTAYVFIDRTRRPHAVKWFWNR